MEQSSDVEERLEKEKAGGSSNNLQLKPVAEELQELLKELIPPEGEIELALLMDQWARGFAVFDQAFNRAFVEKSDEEFPSKIDLAPKKLEALKKEFSKALLLLADYFDCPADRESPANKEKIKKINKIAEKFKYKKIARYLFEQHSILQKQPFSDVREVHDLLYDVQRPLNELIQNILLNQEDELLLDSLNKELESWSNFLKIQMEHIKRQSEHSQTSHPLLRVLTAAYWTSLFAVTVTTHSVLSLIQYLTPKTVEVAGSLLVGSITTQLMDPLLMRGLATHFSKWMPSRQTTRDFIHHIPGSEDVVDSAGRLMDNLLNSSVGRVFYKIPVEGVLNVTTSTAGPAANKAEMAHWGEELAKVVGWIQRQIDELWTNHYQQARLKSKGQVLQAPRIVVPQTKKSMKSPLSEEVRHDLVHHCIQKDDVSLRVAEIKKLLNELFDKQREYLDSFIPPAQTEDNGDKGNKGEENVDEEREPQIQESSDEESEMKLPPQDQGTTKELRSEALRSQASANAIRIELQFDALIRRLERELQRELQQTGSNSPTLLQNDLNACIEKFKKIKLGILTFGLHTDAQQYALQIQALDQAMRDFGYHVIDRQKQGKYSKALEESLKSWVGCIKTECTFFYHAEGWGGKVSAAMHSLYLTSLVTLQLASRGMSRVFRTVGPDVGASVALGLLKLFGTTSILTLIGLKNPTAALVAAPVMMWSVDKAGSALGGWMSRTVSFGIEKWAYDKEMTFLKNRFKTTPKVILDQRSKEQKKLLEKTTRNVVELNGLKIEKNECRLLSLDLPKGWEEILPKTGGRRFRKIVKDAEKDFRFDVEIVGDDLKIIMKSQTELSYWNIFSLVQEIMAQESSSSASDSIPKIDVEAIPQIQSKIFNGLAYVRADKAVLERMVRDFAEQSMDCLRQSEVLPKEQLVQRFEKMDLSYSSEGQVKRMDKNTFEGIIDKIISERHSIRKSRFVVI